MFDKINSILSKIDKDEIMMSDTLGDNYIIDEELDEIKLQHLLTNDYSEAYERAKQGFFIFRGDTVKYNMSLRTPGIRVSLNNGLNYYNRLFSDIFESWKNYPKRNEAFICTSAYRYALCFSKIINIVLPKNGTLLGICPKWDMWRSFSENTGIERMLYFNQDLGEFFKFITNRNVEETNELFKTGTIEEIKTFLTKITESIINGDYIYIKNLNTFIDTVIINKQIFNFIVSYIRKNHTSIIILLSRILNPDRNGFKLIDIPSYSYRLNKFHELWFSNQAIFLNLKYLWDNKENKFYREMFSEHE
jgi:hypothetical protein